ncbi:hypothetical protein [Vibrio hippocampi]|uniref:hypothetical protein n=1 Tax=Vibrio hippocampi TaxID=654686 RepID=UPI001F157390|nr:hypothetical protein [Vibrio hippocampi]
MSAKFTHIAWQQTHIEANEKLVLLKLADLSGHDGSVAISLKEIAAECLMGEFALADMLTALANKGLVHKVRTDNHVKPQVHHLRLTIVESNQLPVIETSAPKDQPEPQVTTMQNSNAPGWSFQTFDLYKVPPHCRDVVWQNFARQNGVTTTNINRLARQLEDWLEFAKRSGQLQELIGEPKVANHSSNHASNKSNKKSSPQMPESSQSSQYISTHELNEFAIPDWAMQTITFSRLEVDPKLFWEKFVVYYKARANEFTTINQILNKLRLWIVNEKQAEDRRKQSEERRRQSYQGNPSQDVSPSEEFREFLRGQGKNPNF